MQTRLMLICIAAIVAALPVATHSAGAMQHAQLTDALQVEPTDEDFPPEDWRGYRFCEVLVISRSGMTANINIYNTIGFSQCPDDVWTGLDADALAEENNTLAVGLNGPRYWLVNEVVGPAANPAEVTATFGDLETRQVAELSLPIRQLRGMQAAYTERDAEASTTFIYHEGNRVYELVAPDDTVYRMQIFSQVADPTLTMEDLETVGDRLDLPAGWRFESYILTEDEEVVSDGVIVTLQDELQNTYLKINQPD